MFESWPRKAQRALRVSRDLRQDPFGVADRHHTIGIVRIFNITWLHSYENRNDSRLIVLITGDGQIGAAAFSYLEIALLAAGHLFASV